MSKQLRTVVVAGLVALSAGAAWGQGVFFITNGRAGLGISSPAQKLHVQGATDAKVLVENTGDIGNNAMFVLRNNGRVRFQFEDTASSSNWFFQSDASGLFTISKTGTGGSEVVVNAAGDMTLRGDVFTSSCSPCTSDYVFEAGYELMPLDELEAFIEANNHLPNIPSEAEYQAAGKVNLNERQIRLLEKVEELTLYTLQQQKTIDELSARLATLEK